MRRLFFPFLIIMTLPVIESCCKEVEFCFQVDNIIAINYHVEYDAVLELALQIAPQNDSIDVKNYAIQIKSESDEFMCLSNFNLGTSLYAYSCEEPSYILSDKVESVSIISNADLSDNFPRGSELNPIFYPLEIRDPEDKKENQAYARIKIDRRKDSNLSTLRGFFNNSIADKDYFNMIRSTVISDTHLFKLEPPSPIKEKAHQFTLDFLFKSGKKIRVKTKTVIFK